MLDPVPNRLLGVFDKELQLPARERPDLSKVQPNPALGSAVDCGGMGGRGPATNHQLLVQGGHHAHGMAGGEHRC
jgi:hypothetical protein